MFSVIKSGLASGVYTATRPLVVLADKFFLNYGFIIISVQHESNPLELENAINTINGFRNLHDSLKNSSYRYYEIYKQPLDCYSMSSEFYDANTDKLTSFCRQVLCLQISQNVFDDFNLTLLSGRIFNSDDYLYHDGEKIPAILGYNYSKLYRLGDVFSSDYLFSPFEFQVVGFLNKDSDISMSTGCVELNDYIIIPSIDFIALPKTDKEYVTQKIHYANKTSGKIIVGKSDFQNAYSYVLNTLSSSSVGEYSIAASSSKDLFLAKGYNIQLIFILLYLLCIPLSVFGLTCINNGIYLQKHGKKTLFEYILGSTVIMASFGVSLILSKYIFMFFGYARYVTPESITLLIVLIIIYWAIYLYYRPFQDTSL